MFETVIKSADHTDHRACQSLRVDLKRCLLLSDCCKKKGKTPLECLQNNDVPDECQAFKSAFFECKRSILDMRTRFRGRKGELQAHN
nr:cytochrome c oxidase assembly factor 5-like isoform X2 [Lepeophtheirus salmonis]